MTKRTIAADGLLLLCAAIWGFTFVAQKWAMESMDELSFVAMRFGLGAALVACLLPLRRAMGFAGPIIDRAAGRSHVDLWKAGLAAGCAMLGAAVTQQIGVPGTTSGNAGFITSLYVVGVPLIGIGLGQRPGWAAWLAVSVAVPGLYLLSVSGRPHIEPGDPWILACAGFWAIHVQVIGKFADRCDPFALSILQFAVTAIGALVAALLFHDAPPWHGAERALLPIILCGSLATGLCFTMQTLAQRDTPATHTAIILSLEGVFAAIAGWIALDESFSNAQWAGAALLLGAALLAQLPPPRRAATENPHHQP